MSLARRALTRLLGPPCCLRCCLSNSKGRSLQAAAEQRHGMLCIRQAAQSRAVANTTS